MKKMLLVAIATICSLSAFADDLNLYIIDSSNTEASYPVSSLQKITFESGNVVVTTTSGTTASTAISDVSKMYFGTASTAIETAQAAQDIAFDGQNITVLGGGKVSVFQPSGALVASATADDGQTISLQTLPKGIYVVKMDGKSFKVVKK